MPGLVDDREAAHAMASELLGGQQDGGLGPDGQHAVVVIDEFLQICDGRHNPCPLIRPV
jgi:hypothetical protein